MDYFKLFGIPVQLKVNAAALTPRFFELSRQFHPDYFVNGELSAQAAALENSALLNKAMLTFQNPDETIRYVLEQKGLLAEEEKYALPPAFLAKVMELNEQLMDEENPSVIAGVSAAIGHLQKDIYEPVQNIVENYQEALTTKEELLQVKDYYYKKKYLDRIRRQLPEREGP